MKITYRREMKHNYLIVDPEALVWRNYECRMLAANSIEGVLHFQIRQVDDEIRFYYEITSRQPLDRMLESQSVRAEELRSLVFGIAGVLDRIEQYLLREGSVLLKPEYIYVEPESFRVWLCLIPGLNRDFPDDYGKLLEYLLGKVDHQDKDSVVLAYGLYQETRKENYGMEDILRLFRAEQRDKADAEEPVTEPEVSDSVFSVPERIPADEMKHEQKCRPGQKRELEKKKKPGICARLREWWNRRRSGKEEDVVQVPWEMMFREEGGEYSGWESSTTSAGIQPGQDTVLLTDVTPDTRAKPHYLRALDGEPGDIAISYYPFVIGKQENLVDCLLPHDTVSRLHLRIDRDGDRCFVQDLNSTNGTSVSGHLLENNESAEIHPGDEIHIAKFRYRFE